MRNQAVVLIGRLLAATLGVPTRHENTAGHNLPRTTLAAIVLVAVTACGGGGSSAPPPPPPPAMYSIGGSVSGLDAGQSVVLQLNGGDDLTVDANVTFTFASKIPSGSAYSVTVAANSTGKTCTVTGGAGTASANVTTVVVACVVTPTYTIGGAVSGLAGRGLEIALERVSDNYNCYSCVSFTTIETLGVNGDGQFVFATELPGGTYRVEIQQQPQLPAQRCEVQNNLGEIGTANVTNVGIVCGAFAYVSHSNDETISAFGIDAATGAIGSAGTVAIGGQSPYSMASTPDKAHLYVGNSSSNNISAFTVDAGSGALTPVTGAPFAAGTSPRSLAVISSIGLTSTSHFFSYSYLYVANAGSDNLSAYRIDKNTGVPTPLSPATYATGTRPSAIAVLPWMPQVIYVANAGSSSDISGFQVTDYSGALTPLAGSPFPSGSSVNSLAIGAAGTFLYAAAANGDGAAIYGFSIAPPNAPTRGALASLTGFPFALPSCKFIVADQTGTYLYAIAGIDLLGYSIDVLTGSLHLLPGFPIALGATVQSVSIDPTNQFLYVANGSAGSVTRFTLNGATGALTPMTGSPFAVGSSADYVTTF